LTIPVIYLYNSSFHDECIKDNRFEQQIPVANESASMYWPQKGFMMQQNTVCPDIFPGGTPCKTATIKLRKRIECQNKNNCIGVRKFYLFCWKNKMVNRE
jgi:hypothetical protein